MVYVQQCQLYLQLSYIFSMSQGNVWLYILMMLVEFVLCCKSSYILINTELKKNIIHCFFIVSDCIRYSPLEHLSLWCNLNSYPTLQVSNFCWNMWYVSKQPTSATYNHHKVIHQQLVWNQFITAMTKVPPIQVALSHA